MKIIKTKLQDCVIIEPKVHGDKRVVSSWKHFRPERYADLAGITLAFCAGQPLSLI